MYEDVPARGYFWQHLSNIQRTSTWNARLDWWIEFVQVGSSGWEHVISMWKWWNNSGKRLRIPDPQELKLTFYANPLQKNHLTTATIRQGTVAAQGPRSVNPRDIPWQFIDNSDSHG